MKKAPKTVLISVTGLFLLAMAAIHILLSPRVVGRLVDDIAAKYVEGNAEIGRIRLSAIRNFPNLRIDVDGAAITYPHGRFAEYDSSAVDSPLLSEGRGASADTLASFRSFSGAIDVIALLKGKVHIPQARLEGLRAFAHYYDSTAANWDIIRIPESEDTSTTALPPVALGQISMDGQPRFVFTDQTDTLFAELGFDALQVKGSLQNIDKRRAKDRIGLKIDSLKVSGRLPADTISLAVNHFEIFEHKDHIDMEADALAQLFTWTFGRLDLPLSLEAEVGFGRPGGGRTAIDLKEFKAQLAELPLEVHGNALLAGDSSYVDMRATVDGCHIGEIIDKYISRAVPSLDAFSTDAAITLDAEAKGWLAEGRMPAIRARLAVPDSHFAYEGIFDGGSFDLELEAGNTEDGRINADLKDFCFKIPGADLNIMGKASDVLGGDPSIELEASACTEFAELVKYLPEDSGVHAAGDVDFELSSRMKLSQLNMYGLTDAMLDGHIFSDGVLISIPSDSIFALISRPDIKLSTAAKGISLKGVVDSLKMNMGSSTYMMGSGFVLQGSNDGHLVDKDGHLQPMEASLSASSLNMRGTDSLSIGLRNSRNKLIVNTMETQDNAYRITLASNNGVLFMRTGGNRVTLQNANIAAMAAQRTKGADGHHHDRPPIGRTARIDSLRLSGSMPGDSASVRMGRNIQSMLSDMEFIKKDIDIQLGEGLVKLFRKWMPSGSLSIGNGTVTTSLLPLRNSVNDVKLSFNDNEIDLKSLNVKSGSSSLSASGSLKGLHRLLNGEGRANYRLALDLRSGFLNLNELLAALNAGTKMTEAEAQGLSDEQIIKDDLGEEEVSIDDYSLIVVPANLNADVNITVDSVRYAAIGLKEFTSQLQMHERCLQLTQTSAKADFGGINLDAFYSTRSKTDISSGFNLAFDGITSQKVIDMFPAVDSLVPMLKSFKGKLDCEMAATSQLDTNMNILIPSINGVVKLNGSGLELEDTGSLRKLAQILMFKDSKVGHIDDMSINGIIANNQLEIFPFILGIDRYTLALKGLQNFDQNFKYHISVIDSPLPFKFGVNLWGNFEDWKYRIGKAQYRNRRIPAFTSELDTMQVNLVASIKDIFKKGVDAALRDNQEAQRYVDLRKGELGYIVDDDDDFLSAEEQEQLDQYLIDQECETVSKKIEEEIDAMMAKELEEMLKSLGASL